MPGETADYLDAAINQTRFVFAKVMKGISAYDAEDFLGDLVKNAPARVWSVETSDHEAFTHPKGRPGDPKFPDGMHPFREACRASMISPLVRKSKSSAARRASESWRGTFFCWACSASRC